MSFSLSKLTQLNDSKAKERKSNFRPGGAKPRPRPCPPGAQALPKTTEAQAPPEPREAPAEPHEAPPEPKEAPAAPHEAPPEPHEAPAEPHKAPAEPEKTQHGPPAALLAAQAPAEASKPLGARSPAPAEPPPRPLPAAEAAVTAPPEAPRPTAAPSGDVPPGPGSEGLMVSPSKAGPLRSGAQAVTSGPEPTRQSASTAPSAAPSEPPGTADDEGGVSGSDDDPEASLSGLHLKRKGKPKAKGKVTAPASEGCEGGGQQTKPRAVDGDHRSGKGAGSKQTGEEDGAVATSPRRRGKPRKRSAGRSTGQTEEGALDNAMAALSKTEEQRDTRESEPRQKRKYTRRKGKEHAVRTLPTPKTINESLLTEQPPSLPPSAIICLCQSQLPGSVGHRPEHCRPSTGPPSHRGSIRLPLSDSKDVPPCLCTGHVHCLFRFPSTNTTLHNSRAVPPILIPRIGIPCQPWGSCRLCPPREAFIDVFIACCHLLIGFTGGIWQSCCHPQKVLSTPGQQKEEASPPAGGDSPRAAHDQRHHQVILSAFHGDVVLMAFPVCPEDRGHAIWNQGQGLGRFSDTQQPACTWLTSDCFAPCPSCVFAFARPR